MFLKHIKLFKLLCLKIEIKKRLLINSLKITSFVSPTILTQEDTHFQLGENC